MLTPAIGERKFFDAGATNLPVSFAIQFAVLVRLRN
jgi:hypothetical protein